VDCLSTLAASAALRVLLQSYVNILCVPTGLPIMPTSMWTQARGVEGDAGLQLTRRLHGVTLSSLEGAIPWGKSGVGYRICG
jgi:hypothetical protein